MAICKKLHSQRVFGQVFCLLFFCSSVVVWSLRCLRIFRPSTSKKRQIYFPLLSPSSPRKMRPPWFIIIIIVAVACADNMDMGADNGKGPWNCIRFTFSQPIIVNYPQRLSYLFILLPLRFTWWPDTFKGSAIYCLTCVRNLNSFRIKDSHLCGGVNHLVTSRRRICLWHWWSCVGECEGLKFEMFLCLDLLKERHLRDGMRWHGPQGDYHSVASPTVQIVWQLINFSPVIKWHRVSVAHLFVRPQAGGWIFRKNVSFISQEHLAANYLDH